jgi:hypothetical protein
MNNDSLSNSRLRTKLSAMENAVRRLVNQQTRKALDKEKNVVDKKEISNASTGGLCKGMV